jgi:hypothetical protein
MPVKFFANDVTVLHAFVAKLTPGQYYVFANKLKVSQFRGNCDVSTWEKPNCEQAKSCCLTSFVPQAE